MHLFQSTLQYYFGIFNITCNVYLIYEFNWHCCKTEFWHFVLSDLTIIIIIIIIHICHNKRLNCCIVFFIRPGQNKNNSPRIDMSPHSDTLSWFRAYQSLLYLLNAACLPEKQPISICIVFGMTRQGLQPTIYRTRGEHSEQYTTDPVNKIDIHVLLLLSNI